MELPGGGSADDQVVIEINSYPVRRSLEDCQALGRLCYDRYRLDRRRASPDDPNTLTLETDRVLRPSRSMIRRPLEVRHARNIRQGRIAQHSNPSNQEARGIRPSRGVGESPQSILLDPVCFRDPSVELEIVP